MKAIAIDFDGVIHAYSRGWEDGRIYDAPVAGVAKALGVLAARYRVIVFTARDDLGPVREWLESHDLWRYLESLTNVKPKAWAYVDDRAVRFEGSWLATLRDLERLDGGDDWGEVQLAPGEVAGAGSTVHARSTVPRPTPWG